MYGIQKESGEACGAIDRLFLIMHWETIGRGASSKLLLLKLERSTLTEGTIRFSKCARYRARESTTFIHHVFAQSSRAIAQSSQESAIIMVEPSLKAPWRSVISGSFSTELTIFSNLIRMIQIRASNASWVFSRLLILRGWHVHDSQ